MPPDTMTLQKDSPSSVVKTSLSTLLIVPLLIVGQGCSRTAETPPPVVTAADRALPIPVNMPDEPTVGKVNATASSAHHKIAVEDTLEPVPIDDASVPSSLPEIAGSHLKK